MNEIEIRLVTVSELIDQLKDYDQDAFVNICLDNVIRNHIVFARSGVDMHGDTVMIHGIVAEQVITAKELENE